MSRTISKSAFVRWSSRRFLWLLAGTGIALLGLLLLALCVWIVALITSTPDAAFAERVMLQLAASGQYDQTRNALLVECSVTGRAVKASHANVEIFVDGQPMDAKRAADWYPGTTLAIHEGFPHQGCWWLTDAQIREWLGPGRHDVQVTFNTARSNVLHVTVGADSILFDPELNAPTWDVVRPTTVH